MKKKPSGLRWIVQVNFLILGLVIVVYAISYLREQGLPMDFFSFGGSPAASSSQTPSQEEDLKGLHQEIETDSTHNVRLLAPKASRQAPSKEESRESGSR